MSEETNAGGVDLATHGKDESAKRSSLSSLPLWAVVTCSCEVLEPFQTKQVDNVPAQGWQQARFCYS